MEDERKWLIASHVEDVREQFAHATNKSATSFTRVRRLLLPAITEYREVKEEVNDPNYLNQYLGRLLSADPSYPLYQLFETLIND